MLNRLDLNSSEWCNMVFEGKNKEYGAYNLRNLSGKRHVKSLIIVMLAFVLALVSPSIVKFVMPKSHEANVQATALTDIKVMQKPKEAPKEMEKTPPPPKLKPTIKFVPPVIKPDNQVKDEDLMKTQQELNQSKATISVATVKGTEGGVDIADIPEQTKQAVVQEKEEKPFLAVEQMPEFPGGLGELGKFLSKKLKYPSTATEMGIEGTVVLTFVVSKTGVISNIKVIRGIGGGCDEEAIRVVRLMPSWKAGRQNGNAVPVQFTLPIKFSIQKSE